MTIPLLAELFWAVLLGVAAIVALVVALCWSEIARFVGAVVGAVVGAPQGDARRRRAPRADVAGGKPTRARNAIVTEP